MYMALTEYKQSSSSSESEKTDDKPILVKRPKYQFKKCTNNAIKKIKQKIVKSKTKRNNIKFDQSYINEVNFVKHKGYCDMKELYQKNRKGLKQVIL